MRISFNLVDNSCPNKWNDLGPGKPYECTIREKNLGTALELGKAKDLFFNSTECNVDGAVLWYSGYSYAWGVYCTPSLSGCKWEDNSNWHTYQCGNDSVLGNF